AIDRKLFMMKGFHHPDGSQQAFLTGLAHLYNLVPYHSAALCMPAAVAWKWKEADYPHETGCSICKSSRPEAVNERRKLLPLNPMECAFYDPFTQLCRHLLHIAAIHFQFVGNLFMRQIQSHEVQTQYPNL